MPPRKNKRAACLSKPTGRAAKKSAAAKKAELEEDPRTIFLNALDAKPFRRRKRKTDFTLSMPSLNDNSLDENYIETLSQSLGISSASFHTWGKTIEKPIAATTRKSRPFNRGRRAPASVLCAQASFSSLFPSHAPQGTPEPIIPNSPSRSPLLLGLPLEVREKIYAYFLQYPKPILLKDDLSTLESHPTNPYKNSLAFLLVCRQISLESSSFLYRNNTFCAILRGAPKPRNFRIRNDDDDTASFLAPRFLPLFRNIIIDLPKENWGLGWYDKASSCVEKLVQANTVLSSITLAVTPQRVGMSETALGMEATPITFSDFLWVEGRFVAAVQKLKACRVLNVVVRLRGGKRCVVSVNLSGLCSEFRREEVEGELVNEETIKMNAQRKKEVQEELEDLKEKFEAVFQDDEMAIEEGICRVLRSEDSLVDGLKLVERK
jgi:hypothetical protein